MFAGQYDQAGELVIVGRTGPLSPAQSRQLGVLLSPARPGHPWPDEITAYPWGGRDAAKPLTKVEPNVVAEVAVDSATQGRQSRHLMRYLRVRLDLAPADVDQL